MDTTARDMTDMTGGLGGEGPAPGMMTISEVAARLGVGLRYVRRLVADRRIPFYKVGYLIRFDPAEVEAWLESSKVA